MSKYLLKRITVIVLLFSLILGQIPFTGGVANAAAVVQELEVIGSADVAEIRNTEKPVPVNRSKEVESIITSELEAIPSEEATFSAAAAPIPDYAYVDIKGDQAPFTIQTGEETISTISGSLSSQVQELSLPGRNGLGFTLTRTYNSDSAQFDKMVKYETTDGLVQTDEEKFFPIGKGWSWNVPYLEIFGGLKYVHLGSAGTYKIDGINRFVGYAWKDLSFAPTTAVVNGQTAAYVLTNLQRNSYYFNALGNLIQIADIRGNTVNFSYGDDPLYGKVLKIIEDAIGNKIQISYSKSEVVLTMGSQTVTYYKRTMNEKELLSKVADSLGRTTTYDYSLQEAKFALGSFVPVTSNPYALLTGITYPTGAKTVYSYYPATTRHITETAVNQYFKVASREDQVSLSDGSTETYNHKDFTYSGDMGSAWQSIDSFSATISDGLSNTTYTHKKTFIDKDTPAAYYNLMVKNESSDGAQTHTQSTAYTYDEINRYPYPTHAVVTLSSSGTSNTLSYSSSKAYDAYGNITSSNDPVPGYPEGATTTYFYDSNHLLVGVSGPASSTQTRYTEYVRDPGYLNVLTIRTRDGNETGPILAETNNTAYDTFGNATETRFRRGEGSYSTVQTSFSTEAPYGGAFPTQQTIQVTDVDGSTSAITKLFEYDAGSGRLKSYRDGNGYVTRYEYDALNRLTKAVLPDNSAITIAYQDSLNQVLRTDETGVQTLVAWNPIGLKIKEGFLIDGVYANKAAYEYDTYGRMVNQYDALGNKTSFTYDYRGRQKSMISSDLSSTSLVWDDVANTKVIIDPEGYTLKEYYDILGRTTSREETKKTGTGTKTTTLGSYTYDYAGNLLTATDSLSPANTTRYTYDVLGRMKSVTNQASVTSPDGSVRMEQQATSFVYNDFGQLTRTIYPDGKTKQNEYDQLGRLIQTKDTLDRAENYYYDGNGNNIMLKDRSGTYFHYTYNSRNLLLQKEASDGNGNAVDATISYRYDLAGRRQLMTDATGTTAFNYEPGTGLLRQITYPDARTLKLDYDAAGNRLMMTDPFGVNTYYHYDSRNRLDAVGPSLDFANDPDVKYGYYTNSLLKTILQRNGVSSAYSYDGLQVGTLEQKKADGAVINSFAYAYDSNGNQIAKTENGSAYSFAYDQLNRITNSSQYNEAYGYDKRGNRSYMSTTNLLDRPDSETAFDKRDQLTGVTTAAGNVQYTYNGDGLLWERRENGETTRYYWDGDQIIAEAVVSGGVATPKARYIRGLGLIARQDSQGKAFYLHNGHGDVVSLMSDKDQQGNVSMLNAYSYDIFGNIAAQTETVPQRFTYSGEYQDKTTGLQYLRARWYDSSTGRFVSEDSYEGDVANPLSLNLYTYVENNPLRYTDPSGHYVVSKDGKWAHAGVSDGGSEGSIYLGDDDTYAGSPIIENGVITGYLGVSGPFLPEQANYWNDFTFFGGFGSIRYNQDYSLGVKGWNFQVHRADESTMTQRHVHVWGPKNQEWSQNEDGSPHDKNRNSPGGPPNSMKKEIRKQIGWDWDAKEKSYAEKYEEGNYYYDLDSGMYFWVNNGQMFYSPTSPFTDPLGLGAKGSGGKARIRVRVQPRLVP